MEALKWFRAEMAKLTKNKGVLISIIAVLLIPIVYAAVLLSATWSPYDNLSNLPVAVVNKDVGAMSGDEEINVGRDLIEDFKKGRDLGWKFVSEAEAEKGLEDLDYYMVIEIPEDFSKNVTTVLEPEPQQLELRYIQNEGLNFMAAQVTNSATERIREQLGNKITETYVRNLFSQLGVLSDGVQSAADGSEQIYTGSSELKDGTGQLLTALTSKQSDISKLANGAKDLKNGTGELLSSLKGKSRDITALAAGAKELNGGTGLLLQTLKEKAPGVKELDDGAAGLDDGVARFQTEAMGPLVAGLEKTQFELGEKLKAFGPEIARLAGASNELYALSPKISTAASTLNSQLIEYFTANGTINNVDVQKLLVLSQTVSAGNAGIKSYADGIKGGVDTAVGAINGLSTGDNSLVAGIGQLVDGAKFANSKVTELKAGSARLAAGSDEINTGWNSLITNVSKLNQGATRISTGNATVETGWKTMTAGVTQLNSGMKQVSDGTSTVQTGWGSLTDGVTQVDEGLVKLNAGSEELATGLKSGAEEASALDVTDDNIAMFSSPVELAPEKVNRYQYYRDSTAPYILSLGIFVGILLMSFVVDFRKPAEVTSGISWFIGKFLNLAVLAIIQAVVVSLFVLLVLNLEVGNSLAFILFACFVSLTFLTIIFFLVAAAGNIGRFIAFIFIVLQLSTTGSNLPIEMLPEGLRSLSNFLPLTYTNAGFKAIISLDNAGSAWGNTGILFGVLIAFLILAFVVVYFKKGRETTVDVAK
ncbi:YhgE/Pip domain-containing protein [Robertmurraya kyonggiensis]|uniref:YhgE/Pip domain-containing protein n=1 Tax=Robertmurraya kyonggiensis TaxID=1037680 RepID=A0A4U1D7D9_9BACI|nr:YhgE/Pip domain-containing protein [Robertmurraya kyonggiensis]TKC16966.1 YhgE/Pip domain-containing protein [Robertmurraya kyonggiensis]